MGDRGDWLFKHLGLPFYYRHTPTPMAARAAFWLSSFIVLVVIFWNLLYMPYDQNTIMFAIRRALFGYSRGYQTMDSGFESLFNQMFIFAIIVSGIIAPLVATFSLGNERTTGTLEFLRLSPMPTTSIVMGKMFASVYVLHLVSGIMLAFGTLFGLSAGLSAEKIATALAAVILSSAVMHAVGAFCAAFTISFRGFGAVLGLLGIGFCLSFFPLFAWEEAGFGYLAFLSPWGAMDALFWQSFFTSYRYSRASLTFLGIEGAVKFYMIAADALFFGLLVWAAARRLDAPERRALPWYAWAALWLFVLVTSLGTVVNCHYLSTRAVTNAWEAGLVIMVFAGTTVCVLCLLDHPFHRETALARECRRVAENESAANWLKRFLHPLTVGGLAAATAATIILFTDQALVAAGNAFAAQFPWAALIGGLAAAIILLMLFALAFEAGVLSFNSHIVGNVFAAIAIAILFTLVLVPFVHGAMSYERWERAMYAKQFAKGNRMYYYGDSASYAQYYDGVDTAEEAARRQKEWGADPLYVLWRYHAQAIFVYAALLAGAVAGLLLWRQRAHQRLRRTAEKAINADRAPPVAAVA